MQYLRWNTGCSVKMGPFLSKLDGVTELNDLALTLNPLLSKRDDTSFFPRHSTDPITVMLSGGGWYDVPLDETDIDTPGHMEIQIQDPTTFQPVWEEFTILPQRVYDIFIDGGVLLPDAWMTSLPGSYPIGSAGAILGNMLASLSARGVTVTSPITEAGEIKLTIGDDYSIEDGTGISVELENQPYLAGATPTLWVQGRSFAGVLTGNVAIFEGSSALTGHLLKGRETYAITLKLANGHTITPNYGVAVISNYRD